MRAFLRADLKKGNLYPAVVDIEKDKAIVLYKIKNWERGFKAYLPFIIEDNEHNLILIKNNKIYIGSSIDFDFKK